MLINCIPKRYNFSGTQMMENSNRNYVIFVPKSPDVTCPVLGVPSHLSVNLTFLAF